MRIKYKQYRNTVGLRGGLENFKRMNMSIYNKGRVRTHIRKNGKRFFIKFYFDTAEEANDLRQFVREYMGSKGFESTCTTKTKYHKPRQK